MIKKGSNETNAFPISLFIKVSQMNGYVNYFLSYNKYMNFLGPDKELLKKYNAIWNKISNL